MLLTWRNRLRRSADAVPDLTGRVAVVTGASSGIGLAAAVALARRGARVVLVGRNRDRLAKAERRVRGVARGAAPIALRADFTQLTEVRSLAEEIRGQCDTIEVLSNNAGGLIPRRAITADGFETTLQTNHLAPFLLANLLREELRGGRLISTASVAHRIGQVNPADLSCGGRYSRWRAYGSAKQANILFTQEAARRWPDILATSFHPGLVRTRFAAGTPFAPLLRIAPMIKSPEQGAETLVWLASAPAAELVSGGYYVGRTLTEPAPNASDATLAAWLWDASAAVSLP